jgi:hypothetical protein
MSAKRSSAIAPFVKRNGYISKESKILRFYGKDFPEHEA